MCLETLPSVTPALPPAARLLARPGGWCQGAMSRGDAVCLRGAMISAYRSYEGLAWAQKRLYAAIFPGGSAAFGDLLACIAAWNDSPGRTQAEVVAAAVKAAV